MRTPQLVFTVLFCFGLSFPLLSCRRGGGMRGDGGMGGQSRAGGGGKKPRRGGGGGPSSAQPELNDLNQAQRSGQPFNDFSAPAPLSSVFNGPNIHGGPATGGRPTQGPLLENSLRTPALESDRGSGGAIGKVNPKPPKFDPNRPGAIDARNWAKLVEEDSKLKRKPNLPPTLASETPKDGDMPSDLAISAVKVCIDCHNTKSVQKLHLDDDPKKALGGLRKLMKQPSGVSWMKVTEMIRSTRFAHLPKDQERALIAYLSEQSPEQSTEALYSKINDNLLQGLKEPVERPPGWDNPLYRQLLKSVETENPVLNAILNDPALTIYDKGLRRVYQDGGSRDVVGEHHEDGIVLQSWKRSDGSPLFPNGKLYGPLGSGFGTSEETQNFKFIWRPRENGKIVKDRLRVDPYKDSISDAPAGEIPDTQLPVGTIIGEVVYEDGVVKDVRLREIAPGLRTQSTAYRAFTESKDMKKAVAKLIEDRPEWKAALTPLQNHLASNNTLTPGPAIKDDYYTAVIDVKGYQDILPQIPLEAQQELYRRTKFSSALEKEWKREGEKVSYAPTAQGPNMLAARSILHHGVIVNSDSCMRCHEMTGTNFAFFAPNVTNTTTGGSNVNNYGMLYGGVRNNIFSYHSRPFADPNTFGRGGQFSGVFSTEMGRESLSDNRKNPDGTWKIRPGAPIVSDVPENMEKYYR